jgi:hypothetical protein
MALKIICQGEADQKHIVPKTLDLLLRFGQHRNICDECSDACKSGSGRYCKTGEILFLELMDRPDVQYIPENEAMMGDAKK